MTRWAVWCIKVRRWMGETFEEYCKKYQITALRPQARGSATSRQYPPHEIAQESSLRHFIRTRPHFPVLNFAALTMTGRSSQARYSLVLPPRYRKAIIDHSKCTNKPTTAKLMRCSQALYDELNGSIYKDVTMDAKNAEEGVLVEVGVNHQGLKTRKDKLPLQGPSLDDPRKDGI